MQTREHSTNGHLLDGQSQRVCKLLLMFMLSIGSVEAAAPQETPSVMAKLLQPNQIEKELQKHGKVHIIVQLRILDQAAMATMTRNGLNVRRQAIQRAQRSVLDRLAIENKGQTAYVPSSEEDGTRLFRLTPLMAMEVSKEQLDSLTKDPDVEFLILDEEATASLQNSVPLIGMTGPLGAYARGANGSGQAVAIIDTGVQTSHPFLSPKVIKEACFSSSDSDYVSLCPNGQNQQVGSGAADVTIAACTDLAGRNFCTHGTHVAGIAAGLNPEPVAPPSGVAPQASLIAIQVFHKSPNCQNEGCLTSRVSDMIAALEWLHENAMGGGVAPVLASVNISIAYGLRQSPCDENPMKPIIDLLRQQGVVTVAAAGNNGSKNGLTNPACISTVVAVGSTQLNDSMSNFSNQSPYLDVLGPGSDILSSIPVSSYTTMSGTSMASPHVAGAFAAIRSSQPDASADRIEAALKITGMPVTGAYTKPRIQVDHALQAVNNANWFSLESGVIGNGTVTRYPGGAACGNSCVSEFPKNTEVELVATAGSNSRFSSWSGACQGAESICIVNMTSKQTVSAEFKRTSLLGISAPANGRIVSQPEGIDCQPDCTKNFDQGTEVVLTAIPNPGYVFNQWSSACRTETTTHCTLVLDSNKNVGASFFPAQTLEVINAGGGKVISTPASADCSTNCQIDFRQGITISVRAEPDVGWEFKGWAGDCVGQATCTLEMSENRTVTAQFNQLPTYLLNIPRNNKGIVYSNPQGITCGFQATSCKGQFSQVSLKALPATGYELIGWRGCPSVVENQICQAHLQRRQTIQPLYRAAPRKALRITKTVGGSLASEPVGLICKPKAKTCKVNATAGQTIRLFASAEPNYTFKGWSGACSGQEGPACELVMQSHQSVMATFERAP